MTFIATIVSQVKSQRNRKTTHTVLDRDVLVKFYKLNINKINNNTKNVKLKLMDKFNRMMAKQNAYYTSFSNIDHSKWILNMSNRQLPESVTKILSLGDNFALPINRHNKKDRVNCAINVIKIMNLTIKNSQAITDVIRSMVANSLYKYLVRHKRVSYIDKQILDGFKECKIFFKKNNDIIVTKADEGQVTVVMNKDSCETDD